METEGHDKEAAYEAKMVKKTVLARQRRKMRRKELLGSMTAEERKEFVANEAREEEERVRRLAEAPEKGQRIAIDCGYDGIMSNKEVSSLSKQIKFCYGTIKRMDNPFALTVTDCSEGSRIASALKRFSADKWSIKLEPSNVSSLYPQSDLVFLTPDSSTTLTSLDFSKVYVIGGIVDRSRVKGRSLEAATALGVATARLPIQEYVPDRHTDHVLNVNTVVEILASIQAGNDWPTTLAQCLPKVDLSLLACGPTRWRSESKPV
ncbi:hypothetical protein, variant [Aphanomyces invadans]|uniref:tRNA (guanine(9)-N(1))-methyltransferase n=1 Tax=Aphanomyces invadans TaxID=157072 RepID=A0A024U4V3_9STRA|nr:hypothetical protein, variant [Aphanomyces invadans]ETW01289.1 hypothetical protein, variant [Aphanomyces invadans]|eukprot:XP_008870287.1 hypothetical protein, variant [Aphanomyces invadans]